jgi:hypothetical protein
MSTPASQLAFHGSVTLLYGLLMGAPYGRAIVRKAPDHVVAAWKLIHLALSVGAALMFAVAAVLPMLSASETTKSIISISLIVTSYSLGTAMTMGALTGERGLAPKGSAKARIVYAFNALGAYASLVAAVVLVYATYCSL